MTTCSYCTTEADHVCAQCDRRICSEHTHRFSFDDHDEQPDTFCEPTGGEAAKFYRRHGRSPGCGEALS